VSDTGGGEPAPTLVPHASRFFARPATRAGHWAAWMSLIAFAALIAFNVLTDAFERQDSGTVYDVMQVTRLIILAIFAVSGLGALALSLRSLMRSERSIIVWAALAVGLFATTLIIGEFTFME
jgi:hypothetical protein